MKANELETYPPLESVTRPMLTTAAAAYYLNRRPQTMRVWAMTGHPIQPIRCHGRLGWPTKCIRELLELCE
jgi:hypothetical protein